MDHRPHLASEVLGPTDREAVVETLCLAFREYPVMTFVLGRDALAADDPALTALIGFYTDRRLLRGWPVLGVREGEVLQAAALVSRPEEPEADPAPVRAALATLAGELGDAAFERMQRFEDASDANEPETDHLFVGMLGVRPSARGRGYGRVLLDAVQEAAEGEGRDGVCLSTEDPANLPFYRHVGFELVGQADVGGLTTWCLFRPTGTGR